MTREREPALIDSNYAAVHYWIHKNYGKATHCSNDIGHTSKRFEWANIDGIYEKDIIHFKQLCRSCHAKMDVREYTRHKNSTAAKITRNYTHQYVPIMNIDTKEVYESASEASRKTGIKRTGILNSIAGSAKTAGGFKWKRMDEQNYLN